MSGASLRRVTTVFAVLAAVMLSTLAAVNPAFAAPRPGRSTAAAAPFQYSGTLQCPSPPAGWDPTTATTAELHFYGLPVPKVRSGSTYLQWVDTMRHSTQRVCTPGTVSRYHNAVHSAGSSASGDYLVGLRR